MFLNIHIHICPSLILEIVFLILKFCTENQPELGQLLGRAWRNVTVVAGIEPAIVCLLDLSFISPQPPLPLYFWLFAQHIGQQQL